MFGFSRRRMKLGRLKVQLSDGTQGTKSPVRHPKRNSNSNGEGEGDGGSSGHSDEIECHSSAAAPEISTCTSGSSENWMVLSIAGDKPTPRFNHAAAVIGNKMIVVGGESGTGLLDDVQVLNFDRFSWTTASSKLYLSPSSLPLKIPACKGHSLVSWGKKALLIGGKTDPGSDRISVWAFDTETECWSLMEAKGDIPMAWSRLKIQGFHPSPRAGCCGVLCGTKWYITGGGSKKKRHGDTLIFDIVKMNGLWQSLHLHLLSLPISLVLVQHKEKDFLVAFGGSKKEPSNQVEVLIMEKNESALRRRSIPNKGPASTLLEKHSAPTRLASQLNDCSQRLVDSVARQNLASAIEHGSGRKSLSESLIVDPSYPPTNISLRKRFDHDEENSDQSSLPRAADHRTNENDHGKQMNISGVRINTEEQQVLGSGISNQQNPVFEDDTLESDNVSFPDNNKSGSLPSATSNIYHYYESKVAALIRKNGILEGQLAASLASKEAVEKSLSSVLKSRQEMEKKLADALKEMDLLREKLAGLELAQEESSSLSNIVHSDNVRLEHDVAFLKAVLDDTQKELHSTRGVIAGERARAFQLQYEVFHLKQRLQSMENRSSTPRKPFHVQ
ncbi:Kelch-type beta propeller [Sesbania bispinosa]|nr:Kelch-type beta propeller [Sesbania bispinosa]